MENRREGDPDCMDREWLYLCDLAGLLRRKRGLRVNDFFAREQHPLSAPSSFPHPDGWTEVASFPRCAPDRKPIDVHTHGPMDPAALAASGSKRRKSLRRQAE